MSLLTLSNLLVSGTSVLLPSPEARVCYCISRDKDLACQVRFIKMDKRSYRQVVLFKKKPKYELAKGLVDVECFDSKPYEMRSLK